jgi:hypothetical protein
MMRGTFNSEKVVDYGDGHIVLDAQQQMAFQEQMRHADLLEWRPRPTRKARNPLLAEDTSRSVVEERRAREVVRIPPEKRVLLGGSFVLKKDLCTERRNDYEMRQTHQERKQKEQEERLRQYKLEQLEKRTKEERQFDISNQDDSARGSARLSTARSRLNAAQTAIARAQDDEDGGVYDDYGGGEDEDRTAPGFVSNRSYGRTPRPQSAAVRSSRGPEIDDDDKVESYFAAARATGRSSARPQSAYSGRSGMSERASASVVHARPQSAAMTRTKNTVSKLNSAGNKTELYKQHKSSLAGVRAAEVRKLAMTRPKVAAAVRAHRAEQFLDEQAESRQAAAEAREATLRAAAARPQTAGAATRRRNERKERPGSAPFVAPENPAERGIPEGGNWKSVGAFRWNDQASSQLLVPWASHYQAKERYPEPVYSARTKKQMLLETKMREIQGQLATVEAELEKTRAMKGKIDENNSKTRAANGLPPKQFVAKNKTRKNPFGKSRSAPGGNKGLLAGDVTMSKSARAFMDNL